MVQFRWVDHRDCGEALLPASEFPIFLPKLYTIVNYMASSRNEIFVILIKTQFFFDI